MNWRNLFRPFSIHQNTSQIGISSNQTSINQRQQKLYELQLIIDYECHSYLGNDLISRSGFETSARRLIDQYPDPHLNEIENIFSHIFAGDGDIRQYLIQHYGGTSLDHYLQNERPIFM